jgi:GAF domain-containing protein
MEQLSTLEQFVSILDNLEQVNVDNVLELILAKTRRLTRAEAGTIYLCRPSRSKQPETLLVSSIQNDKIPVPSERIELKVDQTSVAGYVSQTGDIVEIDDLYKLDDSMPYTFNRAADDATGYHSKSMLAFPLKNLNGQVVGVVQLINHIARHDEQGNAVYAPFPFSIIDDIKRVILVLGVVVQWADLTQASVEQTMVINDLEQKIKALEIALSAPSQR